MATVSGVNYNPVLKLSYNSSADYSAAVTNVAVYLSAEGEITRCGANAKALGIMVNKPGEDEQAEVIVLGTAPMKAGTTITLNDYIKTDALGEADVADTDKDEVIARALQGASDGDIFEVELMKFKASI